MKAIIDGKLYDSEKAELITGFSRWKSVNNLMLGEYDTWIDCELYRTEKGNWFELEGTDLRSTRLNALTEERAKEILQTNPEKYQELYPDEIVEA